MSNKEIGRGFLIEGQQMKQNIKIKHEKKEASSEHTIRSMDELRLSAERIRQHIEAEGQKHTDSGELQHEDRER